MPHTHGDDAGNHGGEAQQPPISYSARRPGKRLVQWRRDVTILTRLEQVEVLHLQGLSNYAMAARLGVDESVIRDDLKRLQELWLARVSDTMAAMRARVVAD